ncbi:glutamate-cysteine ligase family protein [Dactylosporangium sp. NPDC005572]|uniref:glutamate-cysteine ligase family protein n=1 Tax=Dactylosporangium sp. NPDC005572 TaxID=3156889 RepID=UPI0033AD8D7E
MRRPSGSWTVPAGVTFADWVGGALHRRPTYDDLDYHLGTLFPLVRPRGHLQIRYLDAQPGRDWFAPVALLAGLLGSDAAVDAARAAAAPAAGRWIEAARYGLTDSVIAATAPAVLDVALAGVPAPLRAGVVATVEECFRRAWPFG